MPYLHVILPAGTTVGETVDATIGKASVRVTLMAEKWLRIEPDKHADAHGSSAGPWGQTATVGRILATATEAGQTSCFAHI